MFYEIDVFQKFKDDEGRFDLRWTKDAGRLMSLYEAAQFEHPGEDTLDEAKTFAKTHLRALVPFLEPSQAKQVEHVLQHPFHMSLPRIEARRYIETFRHGCELTEQHMVDLAILDFNHVQSIHQTDLQEFSRCSFSFFLWILHYFLFLFIYIYVAAMNEYACLIIFLGILGGGGKR